jgi:hypothetical protein
MTKLAELTEKLNAIRLAKTKQRVPSMIRELRRLRTVAKCEALARTLRND